MGPTRLLIAIERLIGALMLGVATIFQSKARIDDHWSTSPKVVMGDAVEFASPGDPPHPLA